MRKRKGFKLIIAGAVLAVFLITLMVKPSQIVASNTENEQPDETSGIVIEPLEISNTASPGATDEQPSDAPATTGGPEESGGSEETATEATPAPQPDEEQEQLNDGGGIQAAAFSGGIQTLGIGTQASNTIPASISGKINSLDRGKICVLPSPITKTGYSSYSASESGMQAALFDLYRYGNKLDYVIYVGSDLDLSTSTEHNYVARLNGPDNPTIPSEATIRAAGASVGTLCFVGSYTDPTNTTSSAPSDASMLNFADMHIAENIIFRNIKFHTRIMFLDGYDFTIDHGAYYNIHDTLIVFAGGTDRTTVANNGATYVTIKQTGIMRHLNVHGGVNSGDPNYSFTGDVYIDINSSVDGQVIVAGGGIHTGFYGNSYVKLVQTGDAADGVDVIGASREGGEYVGNTYVDVTLNGQLHDVYINGGSENDTMTGDSRIWLTNNSNSSVGSIEITGGSYSTQYSIDSGKATNAGHVGDTYIDVTHNGASKFMTITGGSNYGTHKGNSNIKINNIGNSATEIYGGSTEGRFLGTTSIDLSPTAANCPLMNIYGGSLKAAHTGHDSGVGTTNITIGGKGDIAELNIYGGNKQGSFKSDVNYSINTKINYTGDGTVYPGGSFNMYGGNEDSDVADSNVNYDITLTGDNNQTYYGGNKNGGVHIGDVTYTVVDTRYGNKAFYGGSKNGICVGSTLFNFNNYHDFGNIIAYGGNQNDTHVGNVDYIVNSNGEQDSMTIFGGSEFGSSSGEVLIWVLRSGHNLKKLEVYGGGRGELKELDSGTNEYKYTGSHAGPIKIKMNDSGSAKSIKLVGGNMHGDVSGGDIDILVDNTSSQGDLAICGGNEVIGTVYGDVGTVVNNAVAVTKPSASDESTWEFGKLSVHGGGIGASPQKKANVQGNVSNVYNDYTMGLVEYYGGVEYGDIGGMVYNKLSGTQAIYYNPTTYFYGGSRWGDIGVNGKGDPYAIGIINEFDSTKYLQRGGVLVYTGANEMRGSIYGEIINEVATGKLGAGQISSYSGAGGKATANITGTNTSRINATNTAVAPVINITGIESSSGFRVYGNISNVLKQGLFSDGSGTEDSFTRGAGYGGYIKGNVSMKLGTGGLVYGHASCFFPDVTNTYTVFSSPAGMRLGEYSKWNVAAGGGTSGNPDSIFINGSCSIEQLNVIANYTFGGGFGGVINGNTGNTLRKGTVHSLEGGGYRDYLINGTTTATLANGEVDWLINGGGRNTANITGNSAVNVLDGIVNGSIAGHYGETAGSAVWGNSTIKLEKGNLSGVPGTEKKAIIGGALHSGKVLGDVDMDLNFQKNSLSGSLGYVTKLPEGAYISGGRPFGADFAAHQNNVIGRSATNKITMSVTAPAGSDVLNGASIYGDGGGGGEHSTIATDASARTNSKPGNIDIYVDAPGSSIGNLFATSFQQASAAGLSKKTSIHLVDAASVKGISGGSNTDDFTNAIVAAKAGRQAEISIAGYADTDPRKAEEGKTIAVGSKGISNFTKLSVSNVLLDVVDKGFVRNGSGADSSTHKANYSAFGNMVMNHGAGLKIDSTSPKPYMSLNEFKFHGRTGLTAPGGADYFLLSCFAPEKLGETDGLLSWTKNNKVGMVGSTGTWFGQRRTYQVLTFTDGGDNALAVTPYNLAGQNEDGTEGYVGDNDVTKAVKYGLAGPGIFLDADVVEGQGYVMHNIENVKDGSDPDDTTIGAYGTVQKGELVTSFRLALPKGATEYPTVTFVPETAVSGSWVKGVTITSSEQDEHGDPTVTTIAEAPDSTNQTWTSANNSYSYSIEARFTNEAELAAHSVIITESEAASLTIDDVKSLTGASGRPFFGHNIDEKIAAIRLPLAETAGDETRYRVHPIDYRAGLMNGGVPSTNYKALTVNVIVVADGSLIADDKQSAIYAQDTSFSLEVAAGLTDQASLDGYTLPLLILADGTTKAPVLNTGAIADIKAVTEPSSVVVSYSYTKQGESTPELTKPVTVTLYDDYVCKIGTTGYSTLQKAIDYVNAQPTGGGEYVIEMLVDNYTHDKAIALSSRQIALTTAAKNAAQLPYKGGNAMASIAFANDDPAAKLVTLSGSAGFRASSILLDGTGMAEQPVMFIDNQGTGGVVVSNGAELHSFSTSGSFITNGTTLKLNGGVIRNNATAATTGLIHNKNTMEIIAGSITGNTAVDGGAVYNTATGDLSINDGTITGNILTTGDGSEQGAGIYQAGSMSVAGEVTIYNNLKAGKQNNVYLHATSTESPFKNYIDVDVLEAESRIGVLTDTSTQNGGKGILYTIIGMPKGGSLDLTGMAKLFTHDQLDAEPKAYHVIMDERTGGKNLVLGYGNAIEFSFVKVDATDHSELLQGAEFNLYACESTQPGHIHAEVVSEQLVSAGGCWQPVKDSGQTVAYTSDENGLVDLGAVENGEYLLVESKAPDGYAKPVGQWKLKIDSSKAGYDRIGIAAVGDMLPPAFARNPLDTYSEEFLLPNIKPFKIANAGGWGVYPFIGAGVLLMLAGLTSRLYGAKLRKRASRQ